MIEFQHFELAMLKNIYDRNTLNHTLKETRKNVFVSKEVF